MKHLLPEENSWLEDGLISQDQFDRMEGIKSGRIFSLFWELQFALYAGVILLTTGIGVLIYKYIGSLGHILAIIALSIGTGWAYYYLITRKQAYSNGSVEPPNAYFDYVTLLASLLFSLTITYIEIQFQWFDPVWRYIPLFISILYFITAYLLDHKGVLALAIISFCSFLGLNVQPDVLDLSSAFNSLAYSYSGLITGIGLAAAGLITDAKNIKKHFKSIYMNFAAWLILGSAFGGMFDDGPLSFFGLIGLLASGACLYYSWINKSSWFALYGALAGYIIITAMLMQFMDMEFFLIASMYFIFSPIAPILLIVKFNRAFKK